MKLAVILSPSHLQTLCPSPPRFLSHPLSSFLLILLSSSCFHFSFMFVFSLVVLPFRRPLSFPTLYKYKKRYLRSGLPPFEAVRLGFIPVSLACDRTSHLFLPSFSIYLSLTELHLHLFTYIKSD